jgi:hypothetical protein
MLLEWNKLEESNCRVILVASLSLENWGLKPFEAILRNKMMFLGVPVYETYAHPLDCVLHSDTFPIV